MDNTRTEDSLEMVVKLTQQCIRFIHMGDISNYQKSLVLAQQGLDLLFNDLCVEVRNRSP